VTIATEERTQRSCELVKRTGKLSPTRPAGACGCSSRVSRRPETLSLLTSLNTSTDLQPDSASQPTIRSMSMATTGPSGGSAP
jgi:hypothetical protein